MFYIFTNKTINKCLQRTITDLFDIHERGNAMGLFLLGPLVGPVVGPIVGGFINECTCNLEKKSICTN